MPYNVDPGLNDVQKRAVELTVNGWPITRIANYLEVSRQSIYQWKKLPAWQDYLREQTGELLESRPHRVQRILDLALEQIEGALIDPEIAPLKRAELAVKWLTLLKENMQMVVEQKPVRRQLDPDTIRAVIREIYGQNAA